jgi:hypothetical protein
MKQDNRDVVTLTQEQKERVLDFAKRMVFKGFKNLTQKRRERLWGDIEWFLTDALDEGYWGWETGGRDDTFCMSDWMSERFDRLKYPSARWEYKVLELGIEPRYFQMLAGTCRAAMDIVNDFPGGVWGWTVGDIRRMYDGIIPDWLPLDGWHYLGDGPAPRLTDDCSITI